MNGLATALNQLREDHRVRALCMSAVSRAMLDHGPIDPRRAEQAAEDIALMAVCLARADLLDRDVEVAALTAERDHYRDNLLRRLTLSPLTKMIADPQALDDLAGPES